MGRGGSSRRWARATVILGLTYQLILFVVELMLVRTRSGAQLRAEVLSFRHQLRALARKVGEARDGIGSPPC